MVAIIDAIKEVEQTIAAIKEKGVTPQWARKVFDLADVHKKHPELKKMKRLFPAFANRTRDLMRKEGVDQYLRLEQRKNVYYLVGKEAGE